MALNYVWASFFMVAFLVACIRFFFLDDHNIFPTLVNSTFDNAKTGFEISLWLTGALSLWLGLLKLAEKGGLIQALSRFIAPFFKRIFPDIPTDHPAMGAIVMNIAANMLGLDNAATPLGIRAMEGLQELNPKKNEASNAQIMFLVLNTSGLTLIPVSIMVYRMQMGANNPADVFIPLLLATFFSTMVGLLAVCLIQKIKIWDKVLLLYVLAANLFIALLIYYFYRIPQAQIGQISLSWANFILFFLMVLFIISALRKKVSVFHEFASGAKEGFRVAVRIIPFLVAMLVGIGVFRSCGAMSYLTDFIGNMLGILGVDTRFVPVLPTALMKPLSGSGARGMMVDAMETFGADSFVGRTASVIQGSTETTFYVLAVYFGAVGVSKTRYALGMGLLADSAGIIAAIFFSYLFFG